MSAKRLNDSDLLKLDAVKAKERRLSLEAGSYLIRKNGIEFRTSSAIPVWTEMTVELEMPLAQERVHGNGIVVACNGNRHIGYNVSMLFTGLSKQDQAHLDHMVYSQSP